MSHATLQPETNPLPLEQSEAVVKGQAQLPETPSSIRTDGETSVPANGLEGVGHDQSSEEGADKTLGPEDVEDLTKKAVNLALDASDTKIDNV